MHQHGIIHRDVKPQNVLVNAERIEAKPGGAGAEGVTAGQGAGPMVPPLAEERARLLEMAQKGSVRGLLQDLQRLEERDGRLGPWIGQLRALVRGFHLKAAQAFLQG